MLKVDAGALGVSRDRVVEALRAEGIPCSSGYGFPLYEQPLFRNRAFGPYLADATARLDYATVRCPNSERLCREEAVWLDQSLLLGTSSDVDDIAAAFEKVYEHRAVLHEVTSEPAGA